METDAPLRGRWWIHGHERSPLPGSLSVEAGSIKLSAWESHNITFEEMLNQVATSSPATVSSVIHGVDHNLRPATLFGCGIDNHTISGGIKSWDIGALAAVLGLKIDSWDQPTFRAVKLEIKYLSRWYGQNIVKRGMTEDRAAQLTLAKAMDLEFFVRSGVRIRFVQHTQWATSADDYKIAPQSSVWFQFDNAESLSDITEEWLPWIISLLGLLMGVATEATSVELFPEDPYEPRIAPLQDGKLFIRKGAGRGTRGRSAPEAHEMVAGFEQVRGQLASLVTEWNRLFVNQRAVIDLFASVAFHHSLYGEARFLFLVQALEIYHSRSPLFTSTELTRDQQLNNLQEAEKALPEEIWNWAKGKLRMNYRSLRAKLSDIFEKHSVESEQLFGDTNLAALRIAHTRHYLTHHSDEGKPGRLLADHELHTSTWGLEAMLWVILLKEIGLHGPPVTEVVRRATGIEFVGPAT